MVLVYPCKTVLFTVKFCTQQKGITLTHTHTHKHTHTHTHTHTHVSAKKYWHYTAKFTVAIKVRRLLSRFSRNSQLLGKFLYKHFCYHCSTLFWAKVWWLSGIRNIKSETPHSVRLLWTSDQPVAETPTWQKHSQQTDIFQWDFKTKFQKSELPQTHALERVATAIGTVYELPY